MDYKQHAVPFFLKSKVFRLSFIYFDCLCSILWDVANNSAPENTVEPRLTTIPFIRPPRYYGYILSNQT